MPFFEGYFTFNNRNSEDYGLSIFEIGTDTPNFIGGNYNYNTIDFKGKKVRSIQSVSMAEPISFEMTLYSQAVMTEDTYRDILKYYFNNTNYKKLYSNNLNYQFYYYNAIFTNPTKIYGIQGKQSGICGIKLTVNLDSQFAWRDSKEVSFNTDDLENTVYVLNDSDIKDYIYPDSVTVELNEFNDTTCELYLQNITEDNRLTKITGVAGGDTITFYTEPKRIVSQLGNNYLANCNKHWLRLLQGDNSITCGIYTANGIRIVDAINKITIKYTEGRLLV